MVFGWGGGVWVCVRMGVCVLLHTGVCVLCVARVFVYMSMCVCVSRVCVLCACCVGEPGFLHDEFPTFIDMQVSGQGLLSRRLCTIGYMEQPKT